MSSRALRRAQRELEETQLREKNQQGHEDESESEDADIAPPLSKPKPSLFAMLGDEGNADDGGEDEDEDEESDAGLSRAQHGPESRPAPTAASKKSKKKKKKAKAKAKAGEKEQPPSNSEAASSLDEIDRALLSLNLSTNGQRDESVDNPASSISEEKKQLFSVLSVDTQNLHAANEMRKLFGRAAVQATADDETGARQRARGQGGGMGIAAAVAGRNGPGRGGLASLALRRNIFIQGKEEWPRATSGGLGMEIVSRNSDGTVEYRFVHNGAYQEVQRQFQACVAGMDPERMIQLLHFNPYHISTLLQVSEIAKQQRDNATASELLERALFTFGRSLHSTFSANLAQGKARLDFRRPENREFWLAVWRYIATLGLRATWRTAFEWAKLLLALSPEEDPYCIRLAIDQLALRGREPQAVVDMVESDILERNWKVPPNLAFSVALAHDRLRQPQQARATLRNAVQQYPWLAGRLCKDLDISPIPKPVWGKEPNDDFQELLYQLYVPKAKDLWNTTEGTSLLVEVCYSLQEDPGAGEDPYWLHEIPEIDIARHVLLSEDRSLLTLLSREIKSLYTSTSDPLPPQHDNIESYQTNTGPAHQRRRPRQSEAELLAELERLRVYFQNVGLERHITPEGDLSEHDLMRALREANTSYEEFRRNTERVQTLRLDLQQLGVEVVFDRRGENGERDSGSDTE